MTIKNIIHIYFLFKPLFDWYLILIMFNISYISYNSDKFKKK